MRVYKYLSIEHAVDDLVKHRLKISEYHDMNDPFELHGCLVQHPWFEEIKRHASEHGVLCFSASDSEPLLWSHYADKYRGCCIGFEINQSVSLERTRLLSKPEEILLPTSQLMEFARSRVRSGKFPIREDDAELSAFSEQIGFEKIIRGILFSKYNGWHYEQEVRILIALKPEQKDGQFYFADFDDTLRPVEVLLGVRCTEEDREKLIYGVNRYGPPVSLVSTAPATDSFKIVRVRASV